MVFGVWLGTLGYAVLYYGERLFVNQWQPFAAVLGFRPELKYQQVRTSGQSGSASTQKPAAAPNPVPTPAPSPSPAPRAR